VTAARATSAARPGHATPESRGRRAFASLVILLIVALVAPLVLVACGDADPFAGVYWEPTTGRRIEIKRQGDRYELYYGRDLRAFPAARDGDRLVITDPMGGKTVIRSGSSEGTLDLVSGGKTSVLKPLPQHQ
jgi:hypothetical protein